MSVLISVLRVFNRWMDRVILSLQNRRGTSNLLTGPISVGMSRVADDVNIQFQVHGGPNDGKHLTISMDVEEAIVFSEAIHELSME